MQSRLAMLEEFYRQDPGDPFNIYGLALEYQKTDPSKTLELFEILLKQHPQYVPTYYHAAKLYESLGKRDDASSVFEKGIEVARAAQDLKALRELQSAYQEMLFE